MERTYHSGHGHGHGGQHDPESGRNYLPRAIRPVGIAGVVGAVLIALAWLAGLTSGEWARAQPVLSGSTSTSTSAAVSGLAGTPTQGCSTDWRVVTSPNPGPESNFLNAVAVVSANDVWAIGYYPTGNLSHMLFEHWDGSTWNVVPGPDSPDVYYLLGAVAISSNDVWAVGAHGTAGTLMVHWDGVQWSVVPSPNVNSDYALAASAVSSDDVWAVGYSCCGVGSDRTLIKHWNGAHWSIVPSPNPGPYTNELHGVAAIAWNDVWAVGTSNGQSLTLNWDGSTWNVVPSPNVGGANNFLNSVVAVSPNDVWAVGNADGSTLTEHWDGSGWDIVPSPNPVQGYNELDGVVALSSNDVWAVGETGAETLVLHWDGSAWARVPSPSPYYDHWLQSVAAISSTNIWAVGSYNLCPLCLDLTLIEHYSNPCETPTSTVTPSPTVTGTPPTATPTRTPTDTPTVTPTACGTNANYMISTATSVPIVPGTVDTGNHCDDCTTNITLPFPFQLYDQTFTSANVSSNGNVQFASNSIDYYSICLPNQAVNYALLPYWDNLDTSTNNCPGCGIFTSVSGQAPDRIFNIEWRAVYHGSSISVNFEARLYESGLLQRVDFVYGQMGREPWNGIAVSGVQRDTGSRYANYRCRLYTLPQGLQVSFTLPPCPPGTPVTPSATRTPTPTRTPTTTPTGTLPTATPTNIPLSCYEYVIAAATATIVPGTVDIGNHCEDCGTIISLPFAFPLYTHPFTSAFVTSFGALELQSTYRTDNNDCLPTLFIEDFSYTIFAHWDALSTSGSGLGIFTSVSGEAPNRVFNIEWRTAYVQGSGTANFEVRLYEGQERFDVVYGQLDQHGDGATVGVQRLPASNHYTQYECNQGGLSQGLLLIFSLPCGTPTSTPTFTPTSTPCPLCATSTPTAAPEGTSTTTPNNTPTLNPNPNPTSTITFTTSPTTAPTTAPTISASPTACTIRFSDVPQGSTFYMYVRCLACRGIVNGYPDGTFKPNNNVTRGQLSKIVSNSAGFSDAQTTRMFQDVPVGSAFQVFIGRLASRGYINGYACGGAGEPCVPRGNLPYFRPGNNATRGQISKIDANAAGFGDPPSGQQFQDVAMGSTYYTYTYRLVTRSVMGGYPCGGIGEPCVPPANLPYFRPNNNATRGQTSKIVANTFFPECNTPVGK